MKEEMRGLILIGFAFIMLTGLVSATMCNMQNIMISGYVYEDGGKIKKNALEGATVYATCLHNGIEHIKSGTSQKEGKYEIWFDKRECNYNDNIKIYSEYNGAIGQEMKGYVNRIYPYACVAMINSPNPNNFVPVVPEFGLFVGALTIIGAVSIFFIVRKKESAPGTHLFAH